PLVRRHSPALNVRAFIPEGRLYKATTIVKGAEGSSGVKTGKSRSEQMFSGLPPKADLLPDLRTTPARRYRTAPSRPLASPRSRAPRGGGRDCARSPTSRSLGAARSMVSANTTVAGTIRMSASVRMLHAMFFLRLFRQLRRVRHHHRDVGFQLSR